MSDPKTDGFAAGWKLLDESNGGSLVMKMTRNGKVDRAVIFVQGEGEVAYICGALEGLLDSEERADIERCPNVRHGVLSDLPRTQYDPECATCIARTMVAEHDHLHLSGEKCSAVDTRCKCGGYHH